MKTITLSKEYFSEATLKSIFLKKKHISVVWEETVKSTHTVMVIQSITVPISAYFKTSKPLYIDLSSKEKIIETIVSAFRMTQSDDNLQKVYLALFDVDIELVTVALKSIKYRQDDGDPEVAEAYDALARAASNTTRRYELYQNIVKSIKRRGEWIHDS